MALPRTFRKAIIVGIDGLDPGLCRSMTARGRLPHLARLAASGVCSPLHTANPAQSPVAWTCLATGTNPGRHGVFDFIVREPGSYLPRLSLTRPGPGGQPAPAYATPTFFDVAARAGLPVTAVRWPVTYPPAFAGATVLAGLGAPDVKGRLGNYVLYAEATPREVGRGKAVTVRFVDGRAVAAVEGPATLVAGKRAPALASLTLTRGDGRLGYALGEAAGSLRPGQWSPYLRLAFDLGEGKRVWGLTRLFLNALEPLSLYCGPIQVDPRAPSLPIASPPDYAGALAEALGGPYSTLGMPEETKGLTDGAVTDEAFLSFCDDVTGERERMLAFELGRFREGLLSVVFDTSDRIQHCFWRLHDPSHPLYDPAEARRLGPVIEEHLARMDAAVGLAMEAAGDDTALFVCSDHGFCSYARSMHLNAWLADAGYLAVRPHDPDDPGELFTHVDWSRTRAYALGFGSLYLNIAGREPQGIVPAGAPALELADEIAGRLVAASDAGRPAVAAVHRKQALYAGERLDAAPDLVVGLRPPYRVAWTSAIGGTGPAIFTDNRQKWSGDHCVDASFVPGTLFANLPYMAPDEGVAQTRLAATVCAALGLSPQPEMDAALSRIR
ncbi:MAG: alkaline phosphatase family protein [Solidesulfovibrio sp.]|uniref:alkaline phosphatase family protein n=1 Tax=Solidesulfovibrio sp. TaxID=2910990 RepID=UPI002B1F5516|nr:alkaline phosphatase family protein [Solidesulfovibrio sp.]MEA4857294.1 alkaline phosphatase family protein [Solidesulfovibrio sp.]